MAQHVLREDPNSSPYLSLDDQTQQFRLLCLLPGDLGAPIECRIDVHSLHDCPSFEALSYHWGDSTPVTPITINGTSAIISHNLGVALQHIRQPQSPRVLWVDAVCINQADLSERNHQVRLMNRVYSTADKVLVWLGEASDRSDAAMDLLAERSAHDEVVKDFATTVYILDAVICRPWWSRLWIVQEIALAKADPLVQCGQKCLPWNEFMTGCIRSDLNIFYGTLELRHSRALLYRWMLDRVRTDLQSVWSKRSDNLSRILEHTKDLEASDPRDKIYGCLGLLQENICENICPDYHLSTDSVYLAAATQILQAADHSFFSRFCFHSHPRRSRPSWVPNFADQQTVSPRNPGLRTTTRSKGWFSRHASIRDRGRLLTIQGFLLDTLETCIELKRSDQLLVQIGNLDKLLQQARKKTLPPLHPFYGGLKRDQHIANILAAGQRTTDQDFRSEYEYLTWQAGLSSYPAEAFSQEDVLNWTGHGDLRTIMENWLPGRYFFITKLGLAGLGVCPVRNGDVVAILGGEPLPTVLRPRGRSYTLVGSASMAEISDINFAGLYKESFIKETILEIR